MAQKNWLISNGWLRITRVAVVALAHDNFGIVSSNGCRVWSSASNAIVEFPSSISQPIHTKKENRNQNKNKNKIHVNWVQNRAKQHSYRQINFPINVGSFFIRGLPYAVEKLAQQMYWQPSWWQSTWKTLLQTKFSFSIQNFCTGCSQKYYPSDKNERSLFALEFQ